MVLCRMIWVDPEGAFHAASSFLICPTGNIIQSCDVMVIVVVACSQELSFHTVLVYSHTFSK